MDSFDKPVSNELEIMIPVLTQTMKYATQALAQSSALGELLIAKGIVTKAELDKQMSSHQQKTKKLIELLDQSIRKHLS